MILPSPKLQLIFATFGQDDKIEKPDSIINKIKLVGFEIEDTYILNNYNCYSHYIYYKL
ncbi:MAG: hypothetical protein ORN85_08575 [Sediminibacterium sp.]|nr:hypothetical protein [Sediminibacterium sp.]